MKRVWSAAAVALTIFVPSVASASPVYTLRGAVEPAGEVTVNLSHVIRHGVKLRKFEVVFRDIPLRCSGGSTAAVDLSAPMIRTPRRSFGATVVTLEAAPGGVVAEWSYAGKLHPGRQAGGTVEFRDREFDLGNGQTDDCASGELHWSASRRPH
jgi:hypothetical protein